MMGFTLRENKNCKVQKENNSTQRLRWWQRDRVKNRLSHRAISAFAYTNVFQNTKCQRPLEQTEARGCISVSSHGRLPLECPLLGLNLKPQTTASQSKWQKYQQRHEQRERQMDVPPFWLTVWTITTVFTRKQENILEYNMYVILWSSAVLLSANPWLRWD